MPTLRTFDDLQTVRSPSVVPVIADEIEIGHLIAHGEAQASAYDSAGRPLGTFSSRRKADAAVRRASFQEIDH